MFRVVTIAREYGSGGAKIAETLAKRLQWNLLDRCLIKKIAEAAQVEPAVALEYDEHLDSWINKLGRSLWQTGFRGVAGPPVELFDGEASAAMTRDLIEEAAAMGDCVIVGRACQCILQNRSDTLRVFIFAPWEERLERIRSRHTTEAEAKAALQRLDEERAAYVRRYYHTDRYNPHLYHLMINSTLGEEAVVSEILTAIHSAEEPFEVVPRSGRRSVTGTHG